MKLRAIAIQALLQLGIVVLGYLFTLVAVKTGFPDLRDLAEASWVLRAVWSWGLALAAVPVLWTGVAVYAESRGGERLALATYAVGIGLAVALFFLFAHCAVAGFLGPPHPWFSMKP